MSRRFCGNINATGGSEGLCPLDGESGLRRQRRLRLGVRVGPGLGATGRSRCQSCGSLRPRHCGGGGDSNFSTHSSLTQSEVF